MKVSASSLKLFRRCPRRWVGLKVLRLVPPEETQATNLGKATHAELEDWILHGRVPKSSLAAKMLAACRSTPHWPDPKATTAEEAIEFSLGDVDWHGVVDWRRKGSHGAHAVIGDWKTSAGLDYALRAGDGLLVDSEGEPDVQAAIYAAHEYVAGATDVTAVWIYGTTREPHTTRVVTVDFDPAKVEVVMRSAAEDGKKMVRLNTIRPELNDVPCNPGACNDFRHPCPLLNACKKSEHGLFSLESDPLDASTNPELLSMDFLSSLKASFPGPVAAPAPAAPPPPVADDEPPPPPPEDDDVPPPPPVDEPHPAELLAQAAVDNPPTRDLGVVESGFINPPEAVGKAAYANPAEAAAGEGVKAPKATKRAAKKSPADSKGFAITADTKFDTGTGKPLTLTTVVENIRSVAAERELAETYVVDELATLREEVSSLRRQVSRLEDRLADIRNLAE